MVEQHRDRRGRFATFTHLVVECFQKLNNGADTVNNEGRFMGYLFVLGNLLRNLLLLTRTSVTLEES